MHETLFVYPATLARYRAAPQLPERERFLAHCDKHGYTRRGLRKIAWLLLIIASTRLASSRRVSVEEIEHVARRHQVRFLQHAPDRGNCRTTQRLFMHTAAAWYGFLGRLAPSRPGRGRFSTYLESFEQYMREERGLSAVTIDTRCHQIGRFLSRLPRRRSLGAITLLDVDRHLIDRSKHGWSRISLARLASSLRAFFRYAAAQHWCKQGFADGIDSPRIYADEGLPRGPDWSQVQALIASTAGPDPVSIRDRAVIILLALYGLRRGEVVRLCLEDIDWKAELLRVPTEATSHPAVSIDRAPGTRAHSISEGRSSPMCRPRDISDAEGATAAVVAGRGDLDHSQPAPFAGCGECASRAPQPPSCLRSSLARRGIHLQADRRSARTSASLLHIGVRKTRSPRFARGGRTSPREAAMTLRQLIANYLHYGGLWGIDWFATARSSAPSATVSSSCPYGPLVLTESLVFCARSISVTTPSPADTERSVGSIAMSKLDTALSCQLSQTCPTGIHPASRRTCIRTPSSSGCLEPLQRLAATRSARWMRRCSAR